MFDFEWLKGKLNKQIRELKKDRDELLRETNKLEEKKRKLNNELENLNEAISKNCDNSYYLNEKHKRVHKERKGLVKALNIIENICIEKEFEECDPYYDDICVNEIYGGTFIKSKILRQICKYLDTVCYENKTWLKGRK